jgi:hypothetical protein
LQEKLFSRKAAKTQRKADRSDGKVFSLRLRAFAGKFLADTCELACASGR